MSWSLSSPWSQTNPARRGKSFNPGVKGLVHLSKRWTLSISRKETFWKKKTRALLNSDQMIQNWSKNYPKWSKTDPKMIQMIQMIQIDPNVKKQIGCPICLSWPTSLRCRTVGAVTTHLNATWISSLGGDLACSWRKRDCWWRPGPLRRMTEIDTGI